MLKIRKGDTVGVTSGKDKGRQGVIERVLAGGSLVLIPEINIYKKHVKGGKTSTGASQKGGIYEIPRPLSVASVSLVCPKCKKLTRVGFEVRGDGKVRICKKCKATIEIIK